MMHRFKLRKQGAVKYPNQHGAAKRAGDLSHDNRAPLSARKQANSHRATVTAGFRCPKYRRSGTPSQNTQSQIIQISHSPEAGAGQFQGAQAADTKKQQPGA